MSEITAERKKPSALGPILARYAALAKLEVAQGWTDKEDPESVGIAAVNYFGTPDGHPPPRDALGPGSRKTAEIAGKITAKAAHVANLGKDPKGALRPLETRASADIKDAVREFSNPPNAKLTIDKKGFDNPLIGAGSDGGRILGTAGAELRDRS